VGKIHGKIARTLGKRNLTASDRTVRGCFLYEENHALDAWFCEAYGGEQKENGKNAKSSKEAGSRIRESLPCVEERPGEGQPKASLV
jgi:hypothetical protein